MKTKKCSTCHEDLPLSMFNRNKTKKDGLNTLCRDCSNERSKQYYAENTKSHKSAVAKRKKKMIPIYQQRISRIKQSCGCKLCGESNACCLDFHHLEPKKKKNSVSKLVTGCHSWATIKKEADKCVVVCANCHRKIHAGILVIR